MIDGDMIVVPELKEPEHLPRPISDTDLQRIIEKAPPHLGEAVMLARHMGFRKAEIFSKSPPLMGWQNIRNLSH